MPTTPGKQQEVIGVKLIPAASCLRVQADYAYRLSLVTLLQALSCMLFILKVLLIFPPQLNNCFSKRRQLYKHRSPGGESMGTMTLVTSWHHAVFSALKSEERVE